jgi:serine/threonine-protein kinase
MARVYLAVQRGAVAAKLVVVKCMRETLARDPAFVRMFVDESRVAVRMNHPNVIHTYEAAKDGDEYFIAMEFLEGKTLAHLLTAKTMQLPLGLHVWVLCEVLSGLAYAHELADFDGTSLGIVHRDVSPSNVFVTRTGAVKLVDFGVAKFVGGAPDTQPGLVKGKLGYAAPEQCLEGVVDARSDVYSVGVMLWEAVAGRPRAGGDTAIATIQARVLDMEPDIAQVCPAVAPELAEIVRRALAFDSSLRYPSAAAFRADLQRYLVQTGAAHGERALASRVLEQFEDEMTHLRRAIDSKVRWSIPVPSAPSANAATDGEPDTISARNLDSLVSGLVRTGPSLRPARSRAFLLYATTALSAAAIMIGLLMPRGAIDSSVRQKAPAMSPSAASEANGLRSTPSAAPSAAASSPALAPQASASSPSASSPSPRRFTSKQPQPHTALRSGSAATVKSNASPPPTAPTAPRVEPGADLPNLPSTFGGERRKRAIDESDPYSTR